MASDPRAQHYIECTECERNAEYYCNTCTDSLCTQCKRKHESRHHSVVVYRERKTIEFCNIHYTLPYIICCRQCEIPVCQKCIKENHKQHLFVDIDDIFESKKEEYHNHISRVRDTLLPKSTSLLRDIQLDSMRCKEEISKILSAMTSKAQALKNIIDSILSENKAFMQCLENYLISELQQQENTMNNHIAYLQNIVDEYEKYILTKQHARFILFQHDNPMSKVEEIPQLTKTNLPSFTDVKISEEDITRLLGEVEFNESLESPTMTEMKTTQAVKKNETFQLIPSASKMTSFTVPGVYNSLHISPVAADEAWISDSGGHLLLTNRKGKKLNKTKKYADGRSGCHSLSATGELIFLHKEQDGIYKITENKKKPTFITTVPYGRVSSIYSSPLNGDILTGMYGPSRVIRYKKTGQKVHQIQYDNTEQPLYHDPHYITENHINGDVCVSDYGRDAVVVVDRDRNYRFSYTGHPPGSTFCPRGISSDTQGHILVCDGKSRTVQMIDKDGHFLSFFLKGINDAGGLSLDNRNNLLWVGCNIYDTVTVYKYKPH